jgi:hypothetical protein
MRARYRTGGDAVSNFRDLSGLWFGRWKVIAPAYKSRRQWFWYVQCQCEAKSLKAVPTGKLNFGHSRSCGCLKRDLTILRNQTHGQSRCREYRIWAGMKVRCNNPKDKYYRLYGGRGIKVCERWNTPGGFTYFLLDMGPTPTKTSSLDRIDNDKGYSKDNCRWIEGRKQSANRRCNRKWTFRGVTKTISLWAEQYNVPQKILYKRLVKSKWKFTKAVSTPVANRTVLVVYGGGTYKPSELTHVAGVSSTRITQRIYNGWRHEEAVETPTRSRQNRTVKWRGRKWSFAALAEHVGVSHHVLRQRILTHKWSASRAIRTPVGPSRWVKAEG